MEELAHDEVEVEEQKDFRTKTIEELAQQANPNFKENILNTAFLANYYSMKAFWRPLELSEEVVSNLAFTSMNAHSPFRDDALKILREILM